MKESLHKVVSINLLQILQSLITQTTNQQEIESRLYLVKIWSAIHLDMVKLCKKTKYTKGLKYFLASEDCARLFTSILKFIIQAPPSSDGGS